MSTAGFHLRALTACSLLLCGDLGLASETGRSPFRNDRYLLLDTRVVKSAENATLKIGTVQKSAANPLFGEEKPWEPFFDNVYPNVIYDRQQQLYKCWYSPFSIALSATGMSLKERQTKDFDKHWPRPHEDAFCYATSKDGIHWLKPNLGIVEFGGTKNTNLLWRNGPHGTGVFKDLRDPDPTRRYKAVFRTSGPREGFSCRFSADGITWGETIVCLPTMRADTHNNAIWAPTLGKYVAMTREMERGYGRVVVRTESDDFVSWSPGKTIMRRHRAHHEPYSMPIFYHAGVYLGLVTIFQQSGTDFSWPELAWSPDTTAWHRINIETPLIPRSDKVLDYDYGCIYCSAPIIRKDKILIYYCGSDWKHTSWRNGHLCVATLRADGFAGFEQIATDRTAVITTNPLTYNGNPIRVSADVDRGGSLKVTVLGENGETKIAAKPITTTVTDARLALDKPFEGERIQLKFELNHAKIYSFNFEECTEANRSTRAPGSDQTPRSDREN